MDDYTKLVALHKHWVTADSINHHLRQSLSTPQEGSERALSDSGQMMSIFAALSVWYSLLYVVVEGYRELNYHDEQTDLLLAHAEYVTALRLFRNATFHYRGLQPSPKLMTFLEAKDSETWIQELNRALKNFFERELDIEELLDNSMG
jgi:hypothetical protein